MQDRVARSEANRVWMRVALQSFGGPAGQIAVMHRILVEEKRWVSEEQFLHALNYCMLLPGPEAQQLATYIGWLLHGTRGGLTAGLLFILPGFLSILALSLVYAAFRDLSVVSGLFFGLQAAVLAIVAQAVLRIGGRILVNPLMVGIALLAFVSIFFLAVPFPVIVLGAGLLGLVGGRLLPASFAVLKGHAAPTNDAEPSQSVEHPVEYTIPPPSLKRALCVLTTWSALWLLPIGGLALWLGNEHIFVQEAVFFSKAAVVTFGGAYAVLAYIAQAAVENYGWLQPGEMLHGLGMAETTPGPLIQVVQFVGFMGAFRGAGALNPLVAGVAGSLITTWVTFVPCFLWIFLGAPYIESLRGNRNLTSALSTITAAVVGVILNLAVWFALHALFADIQEREVLGLRLLVPAWSTVQIPALLLSVGALIATFRFKVGVLPLLGTCAAVGIVYRTFSA